MPSGWGPIPVNLLVDVYWNLRQNCFSVKAREDVKSVTRKGTVAGHLLALHLKDVEFVISLAKRERQMREGKRIIHAYCRGRLVYPEPKLPFFFENMKEVTYDPYEHTSWIIKETGEPIYKAKEVVLDTMLGVGKACPRISVVSEDETNYNVHP